MYGTDAMQAPRASRYRCEVWGFANTRMLKIDQVNRRVEKPLPARANYYAIYSKSEN